ncbi:MAG: P-loop NTPase fold protein [Xenococcus sp. MO_188.B8]|nr:P-loop NTPase fold protein [Xenococcus sp. MO_188.B8]
MENKIPQESSQDWVEERLSDIEEIKDSSEKVEAILKLASRLLPSSSEILKEALNIARGIDYGPYCVETLAKIAPQLPSTEPQLLKQALNIAQWIENDNENDKYRAQALAALAPQLEPQLLKQALNIAQKIKDAESRAKALATIIPQLPETEHRQVFEQTLSSAKEIKLPADSVKVLAAFSPHLPKTERRQVLEQALNTAKEFKFDEDDIFGKYYAEALEALVTQLPATEPQLLEQALNIVKEMNNGKYYAEALEALVTQLPATEPQLLEQALKLAQKIPDQRYCAETLAALAPQLPVTEPELLEQALNLAQKIPDQRYCAKTLAALAPQLPKSERSQVLEQALKLTQEIENDEYRAQALEKLAPQLPNTEPQLLEQALNIVKDINNGEYCAQALKAIAPKLTSTEPHLLKQASNIAQEIENDEYRAQALAAIIPQLPETERRHVIQQALKLAQNREDYYYRAKTLETLAPQLPATEPELLEQALNIAQWIENDKYRAQVLAALAPQLPETERRHVIEQALKLAKEIEPKFYLVKGWAALAPQLFTTERCQVVNQALKLAQEIKDEYNRVATLEVLAPQLFTTESQLLEQALNIVKDINNGEYRAQALEALAPQLPTSKPQLLEQALNIVQDINNGNYRALALKALAPQLPATEPQLLEQALNITKEIEDELYRYLALEAIAPQLPTSEPQLLEQALNITKEIKFEKFSALALEALAPQLPTSEPQLLEQALNIVKDINNGEYCAQALKAIAPQLPATEPQLLEQALNIAQEIEIESKYECARALAALAPQLPATERRQVLEKALNIAQEIEIKSQYECTTVLKAIAPQLPETLVPEFLQIILELESVEPFKELIMYQFREEIVADIQDIHFSKALATVEELKDKPKHQIKFFSAIAPHLPPSLFSTALERVKDHTYFAEALSNLAPYIPIDQISEALRLISQAGNSSERAEALINLVPYVETFDQILQTLEIINDDITLPYHQARCLTALATTLQSENFKVLSQYNLNKSGNPISTETSDSLIFDVDQSLEKIRQTIERKKDNTEENKSSNETFIAIIQCILAMASQFRVDEKPDEKHQSQILVSLAPALPSQFLDDVLEMIKSFKDLGYQVNVLCSLVPVFPQSKEKLLQFAENEIIRKTPPRFNQRFYEVKIWSCFREKQDEALDIATNIDPNLNYLRTEALVEIAAQLQALAPQNITPTESAKISTAQRHALTAIRSLNNSPLIQNQHLQRLAPHLHPLQLLEAKNVAQQISKADYRAEALVTLACHFPSIRQIVEQYIKKEVEQNKGNDSKRDNSDDSQDKKNDKNKLTEIQGIKHLSTLAVEVPNILPDIIKLINQIEEDSTEKEKKAHRYSILVDLKPHFPARINREVARVHRSQEQISDELWNRSCKLLAKSYREILKKGSLRNESAQDKDELNLKDELNALSDLLLMRDLEPPMAVGILGGWGGGKSYIMHLMQSHMTEIRSRPITEEEAWNDNPNDEKLSPFVGHIYQIKFDAWTFAKSDLWASLMQTIFVELDRQISLEQQLQKSFLDRDIEPNAKDFPYSKIWKVLYQVNDEDRDYFLKHVLKDIDFKDFFKDLTKDQKDKIDQLLWNKREAKKEEKSQELETKKNELNKLESIIKEKQTKLEEKQTFLKNIQKPEAQELVNQVNQILVVAGVVLKKRIGTQAFTDLQNQITEKLPQDFDTKSFQEFKKNIHEVISNILEGKDSDGKPYTLTIITKWAKKNIAFIVIFVAFAIGSIAIPSIVAWKIPNAVIPQLVAFLTPFIPALGMGQKLWNKAQHWYEQTKNILSDCEEQIKVSRTVIIREKQRLQKHQEEQIDRLQKELDMLKGQKKEVEQEVKIVEKKMPKNLYSSLSDFVSRRIEKGTYDRHLGLMHFVKEDLNKLSRRLLPPKYDSEEYKRKLTELKEVFPRGPARVVVYIDDLDRCPPDRVVEVLEAVQLLVKTPLFIAVLAIDERYITRALEKYYQGVLSHRGSPSGTDYLEKIIQLPYRVRPIMESSLDKYLRSQIVIQDNATGGAKFSEFSRQEFNILMECCREVDLSPRTLKRLTNVYKLFKIVCRTRATKPSFRVQKTILALLALSGRYPDLMRGIFDNIESCFEERRTPEKAEKTLQKLHLQTPLRDFFKYYKLPNSEQYLDNEFQKLMHDALHTTLLPSDLSLSEMTREIFNLIRSFSFVGEVGEDAETDFIHITDSSLV